MSDKIIENNQVTVIGSVASEFTYSHEVFGEGFYMVDILVKRLSNSSDRIPVMVSERLIDVTQDYKGRSIMVSGQFRSYNRHEEQKNRLVLSVFAREMEFIEHPEEAQQIIEHAHEYVAQFRNPLSSYISENGHQQPYYHAISSIGLLHILQLPMNQQ